MKDTFQNDNNRKPKKKKGKVIYIILLCACICIFAFSAFKLISYYLEGKRTMQAFHELENLVVNETNYEGQDESKGEVFSNKEKYANLLALNKDFIGWISIPDTNISYPVMYTPKDPQYYLHKNFDKEYEYSGVPFVDGRCKLEQRSDNVIIYGHNMKNGTMFSVLVDYKDKEFYDNHRYISFNTIYEEGEYEIVAVLMSSAYGQDNSKGELFQYFNHIDFATEKDFNNYVSNIKELRLYDTGVELSYGDKLITLSTCQYTQEEGRIAVIAKRIK